MSFRIVPSIIAHNQAELDKRVAKIKSFSKSIQLDVMDGEFVKQTSFEFDFKLPKGMKCEVHLMLVKPEGWYLKHKRSIKSVIVHYESNVRLHDFIEMVKRDKKKIGIAINPGTPAEAILQYLKLIDKVLIMTVEPGAYGSKFLSSVLPKITHIRGLKALNHKLDIAVDGGMTPENIERCRMAGANEFIVGSYLQNSKDVKASWKALQNEMKDRL